MNQPVKDFLADTQYQEVFVACSDGSVRLANNARAAAHYRDMRARRDSWWGAQFLGVVKVVYVVSWRLHISS